MTTAPTTPAKKASPAKTAQSKQETVSETQPENNTPEVTSTPETPVVRIPEALSSQLLLNNFAEQYLKVLDEIAEYNEKVIAEKSAEWNSSKVLAEAKKLGNPDEGTPDEKIKAAYDAWESLLTQVSQARKNLISVTSEKLGITLSDVAERDPEAEKDLQEKRKLAVTIGQQLNTMSELTTDKSLRNEMVKFLTDNPLPAIGRDQTRSFTADGGNAPKYRVHVVISRDGKTLVEEDGFTKASQKLTAHFDRGKAPKADAMRKIWEDAGNTSDKTNSPKVEADLEGVHFVITKR